MTTTITKRVTISATPTPVGILQAIRELPEEVPVEARIIAVDTIQETNFAVLTDTFDFITFEIEWPA